MTFTGKWRQFTFGEDGNKSIGNDEEIKGVGISEWRRSIARK